MPTVLIVDDDVDTVRMLRDVLELEGMSAVGVTDPGEVQKVLETYQPDVCLIDLMLRGQCGIELAQEIRDVGIEAPLVAMSGSVYLADVARDAGLFDLVFEKPFDLDELLVAVAESAAVDSAQPLPVLS